MVYSAREQVVTPANGAERKAFLEIRLPATQAAGVSAGKP